MNEEQVGQEKLVCPRCNESVFRYKISIHAVNNLDSKWNTGFEFCGGCPNCDKKRREARKMEKKIEIEKLTEEDIEIVRLSDDKAGLIARKKGETDSRNYWHIHSDEMTPKMKETHAELLRK